MVWNLEGDSGESPLIARSELEGGLDQAAHGVQAIVATLHVGVGLAQVVQSRGDRDVVGDLELVEEFPGVTTTSEEQIIVTIGVDVGDEGGLTHCHTEGVALQEHIAPLEADVPGLGGRAIDAGKVRIADIGQTPTSTDGRNPAGVLR